MTITIHINQGSRGAYIYLPSQETAEDAAKDFDAFRQPSFSSTTCAPSEIVEGSQS